MKSNIFYKSVLAMVFVFISICGCKDDNDVKVNAITVKEAEYIKANTAMELSLKNNETLQLTPFIMPKNASNTAVEFSTETPEMLEVSASGLITPKETGTGSVTISATDGSGVRVTYKVNIIDHMTKATDINVTAAGSNMYLKTGSSFDLAVCVSLTPADTYNKTVSYSSANTAVATVNATTGLVTAVSEGSTVITIATTDGSNLTRDCNVTVLDIVFATGLEITATGLNMVIKTGETNAFDLAACVTVLPDNADVKTVAYQSGDESIVTVSENGIVTGVKTGETTITVTTTDGSNISKTCKVTIVDKIERRVDLDRTAWTVTSQQGDGSSYQVDGSTGKPEDILTSSSGTYLALSKPGRNSMPEGILPYFTVDKKSSEEFNYFRWRHRGNNNYNRLKVFAVHVYGSNDGTTFTRLIPETPEAPAHPNLFWIPIASGYAADSSSDGSLYNYIDIPKTTYRYIRIEYVVWENNYNTAGYQHPDWPGGDSFNAWGNTMCVSEFGLGLLYYE